MLSLQRKVLVTVLSLGILHVVEGNRLSVEEVIARMNRNPQTLQNVLAQVTNEVDIKLSRGGDNSTRIIGGTATVIEDYPHQIALLYFGRQVCGGSIISHSWVLTAAHCVDYYPQNEDITIRAGSSSRSSGGAIHTIYYYHIHENYSPDDYPYDVATIRVQTPFSGIARVIPLTTSEWIAGTDAIVTGWGVNAAGQTPDNLFRVSLPVVDRITCNEKWLNVITDDMICAGAVGIDACVGDSGGPAVQKGILYGIVSWGATACGNGLPGIYTNIAHPAIRDFIWRTSMV
uniref:Putative trypsin-like serine protease n=1 Tax=Culex tarsalis TaxID=7177 RepID=A0A1Q3FPF2_CULTA